MREFIKHEVVDNYSIFGNKYVAIAVNIFNQEDSEYFTIDPDCHNNAFNRACAWAYEPPMKEDE